MKADIILDTRRITKKGYPVKIRVHDVRLLKIQKTPHLYIKTNIYQNSHVLKMSPELKKRDFELSKQLDYCISNNLTIEDSIEIIENGIPKTDLQKRYFELLAELNEIKGKINNTGIFEFFNIYKEEKIKRKENLNVHENTVKHFKAFLKESLDLDEIPLNEITYKVVNDYQIYLINKKLSGTTVNVYIEKLSNIFSESQKREELGIKDKSPFAQLKRVSTKDKIKNKDLSIENLIEFKNLNFSDWKRIKIDQYQFIQDLFLFQFAIGGHDLVDIALLKWDNIINNRIVFQRFKNNKLGNGGPVVNNFLSVFALNFIEKYGDKNNNRIFSCIPEPSYENSKYKTYQVKTNEKYDIIINKFNLSYNIKTKRSRYTFRTIAGNLLINQMIIELLQGHSSSNITFNYQGVTPFHIQDEEHKKILNQIFRKEEI